MTVNDPLMNQFGLDVGKAIADAFTISFLDLDAPDGRAGLRGSGVLVIVEERPAILTADHVLEGLPKNGRLGLLLEATDRAHFIEKARTVSLTIARGKDELRGPDLGALFLMPEIAGAIAAKKVFYNLTKHRSAILREPPRADSGIWLANGFLAERCEIDEQSRVQGLYNFTALGWPEASSQVGDYDFVDLLVDEECRDGAPARWGGMSGGGVWQVHARREGDRVLQDGRVLAGILFAEMLEDGKAVGVRAHGPMSIYRSAYDQILGRG